MKRRDLLKAAGAATVVDFDALARDDGSGTVLSDDSRNGRVLDRLPPLAATPGDGSYDVTVTREVDEEALLYPALLGDAAVNVALVGPLATASVGIGASASDTTGPSLADRGYRQVGTAADQPLYARRTRNRATVVVPSTDDVVTVSGRDPAVSASFARAIVATGESLPVTEPAVATALDLLGEGDVVTIRPADGPVDADDTASDGDANGRDCAAGQQPLVTARRIAIGAAGGAVRDVAVYPTPAESTAALDGPGPWPDPAVRPTTVTREGRALVRDQAVEAAALPLGP